jgi:hypothetical protein
MNDLSLDSKKSNLGQKGLAIVFNYLVKVKKFTCTIPNDVLDPFVDLIIYPKHPDLSEFILSQVKTKVPWIYEESQSTTDRQWERYKQLKSMWIVCAPSVEYASKDMWAGNVYHFNPQTVTIREKVTKSGRKMVLIPLDQMEPLFKVTNKFDLDQMKRFATEEDK